jgi:hypothetical protein
MLTRSPEKLGEVQKALEQRLEPFYSSIDQGPQAWDLAMDAEEKFPGLEVQTDLLKPAFLSQNTLELLGSIHYYNFINGVTMRAGGLAIREGMDRLLKPAAVDIPSLPIIYNKTIQPEGAFYAIMNVNAASNVQLAPLEFIDEGWRLEGTNNTVDLINRHDSDLLNISDPEEPTTLAFAETFRTALSAAYLRAALLGREPLTLRRFLRMSKKLTTEQYGQEMSDIYRTLVTRDERIPSFHAISSL